LAGSREDSDGGSLNVPAALEIVDAAQIHPSRCYVVRHQGRQVVVEVIGRAQSAEGWWFCKEVWSGQNVMIPTAAFLREADPA
jgi:hypothetical protein